MKIRTAANDILFQLAEVISQLDESSYRLQIPRLGDSTLGQHVRHTLEFFMCLEEGLSKGVINYDERRRDLELENDPEVALSTIGRIRNFVASVKSIYPLNLEVDYGMDGMDRQVMETNLDRELAYNIEHAVHHMAILKIGLKEIPKKISIPDGFGIAVSTLRHRMEHVHHT